MTPIEYTCSVLSLLGCLWHSLGAYSSFMGKESHTRAKVQCMRGTDNQNVCPPYYGLLHSLDFLGVISRFRLGSLPCIVCCMLRFAYAHGVPSCVFVMTPPRYLHFSIRLYL